MKSATEGVHRVGLEEGLVDQALPRAGRDEHGPSQTSLHDGRQRPVVKPHRANPAGEEVESETVLEPFLHFERDAIYNPLTDATLTRTDPAFEELLNLHNGRSEAVTQNNGLRLQLERAGWLVPQRCSSEGTRYRL